MTVYKDDYIRPADARGAHLSRSAPEGASNACIRGAPLTHSSGYLAEATSGAALDIVGFARDDGHNDSSAGTSELDYVPTELCNLWKGKLAGASARALVQTDLGSTFGLAKNSDNIWYVDGDESSSNQKSVTVVRIIDDIGTEDGWVYFTLNKLGNPYVD